MTPAQRQRAEAVRERGALKPLLLAILGRTIGQGGLRAVLRWKTRWNFCSEHGFAYWRMSRFKEVQGFLLDEEALALFRLARAAPGEQPIIVEIGSWLGKSSVVLAAALAAKGEGRLYCVDPFDAAGESRSGARYRSDAAGLGRPIRSAFEDNLRRAGVASWVEPVEGYSDEVVRGWMREIDLLFIDGDHSADAVERDFLNWSRFIRPGGIIAFHDTWFSPPTPGCATYHTGPAVAVKRAVLPDGDWEPVDHVSSLFVVRRRAEAGTLT